MLKMYCLLRHIPSITRPSSCRLSSSVGSFNIVGNLFDGGKMEVGKYATLTHTFPLDDVRTFGGLSGDSNPLHVDPEFAKTTMFGAPIVHGIFVSSLIGTIFGRGKEGSVYVSQTLAFKRPVHVGVPVTARVEVIQAEDKRKGILVTCKTTCILQNGDIAIDGEAKVLVPK